jgi:hypothetical protein
MASNVESAAKNDGCDRLGRVVDSVENYVN